MYQNEKQKKEKVYFKNVKQIHIRVTWTMFVMRANC